MEIKCQKCGSPTRMQVQATISAPGELAHKLSKQNLRRADVYILGVLWETADFICTNGECRYVYNGYGNYVTNMKKELDETKAKNIELVKMLQQWIGLFAYADKNSCMCGDSIQNHNAFSNHAPVPTFDYYADQLFSKTMERIENSFDEKTREDIKTLYKGNR